MAMFANSVLFLPTAGGTTDFTVSAAVIGFMTPALAGMPSGTYKYRAESTGLTQWEIGEGVYDSGTGVLTRATVLYNSSGTGTATGQSGAGSKINFSAPPNVGIVQLVEDTLGVDQANSWSTAQKLQVRKNTGVDKNYLYGLTLSNNSTDATNDIDIAAGEAADADGNLMVLASGITKRLDAGWFPGSGNGGMESGGAIANTTYHVWLIQRSDTGVVDVLFSTSATSPTMPANYDRKRRIGSIIRASGAILAFRQYGDVFKLAVSVFAYNSITPQSDVLLSLTVPTGLNLRPILGFAMQKGTAGDAFHQMGDGDLSTVTFLVARTSVASERATVIVDSFITNTSGQIRYSLTVNAGTLASASVSTVGWIDDRGR